MEHEVDVVIRVKIVLDVVTGPFASAVEEARELGAAEQAGVLTSVNPSEKPASAAEANVGVSAELGAPGHRVLDSFGVPKTEHTTGIPNLRKLKSSLLAPKDPQGLFLDGTKDAFEERLAEDEIPSAVKIGDLLRAKSDGANFVQKRIIKELLVDCGAPGGDWTQIPMDRRLEFVRRLEGIK